MASLNAACFVLCKPVNSNPTCRFFLSFVYHLYITFFPKSFILICILFCDVYIVKSIQWLSDIVGELSTIYVSVLKKLVMSISLVNVPSQYCQFILEVGFAVGLRATNFRTCSRL